jgi:DNA-binding NarL/FixJ family response regulator
MNITLLTRRQRAVIEALTECGCAKGAAKKLGVTQRTISESVLVSRGRTATRSTLQLAVGYALAKAQAVAV